jgi:hypothetical protein
LGFSQGSGRQFYFSWGWLRSFSVTQLTKELPWRVQDGFSNIPGVFVVMAQRMEPAGAVHQASYTWPLQNDDSRIVRLLTAYLASSRAGVPRESGKAVRPFLIQLWKASSFYAYYILLVQATHEAIPDSKERNYLHILTGE